MTVLLQNFEQMAAEIERELIDAPAVPVKSWQSTTAPQAMPELLNYSFTLDLLELEVPGLYAKYIGPNLPWADVHFVQERASGHPINPGESYKMWQDNGKSASKHLRDHGGFDHSYAERYWPKYAGVTEGGRLKPTDVEKPPHMGYRYPYGDLKDLVQVLKDDPLTRQAYLPVWFPEDLGAIVTEKARVPCTLGYHFIMRDNLFHCVYPMRSCDYIRHFRDDVYLTTRLQLWILQMLRFQDPEGPWGDVRMGTLTMNITSLHCFEIDVENLRHKWGLA